MSSPTQHSSVLPRQHLSSTAELTGAGGRIRHHAASPLPGCEGAEPGGGTSGSPACSSLGLSGAVGVGLHLPPNTKGTTGISKIEKYENEIRAFNEDPGGHDQDRVCARVD